MNRPKPRYDQPHPQHYRQQHHNYSGGLAPQGPPPNVGQARMPNAGSSMRAQGMNARAHVPQQQQPQQQAQQMQGQQVQQQAHPGSVAVQHQGYPHVSTPGHHPQPMFYVPTQNPHGAPQSYIHISPYTISNPGAVPIHALTQLHTAYTQQPRFTYYGAQHGQSQPNYFHATTGAAPAPPHMYSTAAVAPQYAVHQPHPVNPAPMHRSSQAVANTQQLQQAPVAPTHVPGISAQHQQQHSHPQQSAVHVGGPPPTQTFSRPEQSQERKRNKLKIVNPVTGEDVISGSGNTETGSSSTANADSSAKGASVNESAQTSQVPSTKQDSQNQNAQITPTAPDTKQKDETVPVKEDTGNAAVTTDRKSSVRQEFYHKIAGASDDVRTSSSASTGSNGTANAANGSSGNQASSEAQPGEPVVEPSTPTPTPVPSTPTKDKSPSPEPSKQLVPQTPIANTSSDDSKDASLVSISPTPIENYSNTPRRECIATPPLQPAVEKYEEETVEEEEVPADVAVPVEEEEEDAPKSEPPTPTTEPDKQNHEEQEPEPVQEEVRAESELSDSTKLDESEAGDDNMEVDETEEVEENQPNGHVPLEEGEIRDEDEETAIAEAENDDQEDSSHAVKGKIKYDREFLLRFSRMTTNEFKVGIPDLARDTRTNHINHGVPMTRNSPGGPRDYGANRNRGMPNQGNKGLMQPHMGMRMGMGLGLGMGIGMPIPPPPPRGGTPKVHMSLQREEVKLHKAENAWKPSTLKKDPHADKNVDEEKIMIDTIVKKTRGILNKLTPDNFDKLVQKFMELPLNDNDERISSVIKVVFEKAVDEPSFSTAYARMVHTVCKASQETSKKFRKQILDQCQREFQKGDAEELEIKVVEQKLEEATDDETREQLKAELEDKKFLSRKRSLGNVRFIGELYKLQMLTPKIMVECVQLLLYAPDEEKLECLCKLLTTVGQRLDLQLRSLEEAAAKGDKPKFCPEPKWMDRIFSQLSTLSEDKKFSSRIRFAILDVVELRDNDWKPRRDTNVPKTIAEVRKEAQDREIEEKRQINSLPPVQNNYGGGGDRDHRTGNSRLPGGGPPPPKKGDWTTVQNSKPSSRFQTLPKNRPMESMGSGSGPVLAPHSFGPPWAGKSHSGPSGSQPKNLPPRLQASRFQNLSVDDGSRGPNKSIHNSDPGGFRDHHPVLPPHTPAPMAPPLLPPAAAAVSPPPSTNSSATNSRPVSPKDDTCTADTSESVKNIFQEYLSCKKFDDTLHWIKHRFPGNKIEDFIEELCRQVGEMSREVEQKCAGSLVRLLIKNNQVPKDTVIKLMAQGVMQDLPDILIDSPMATQYLAQFLVEIFSDEGNLNWLVQVGENLIHNEDDEGQAWKGLTENSLNLLKLRNNEEMVQTSFKCTRKKDVIPVEDIPWLQDKTPQSMAEDMVKVLSPKLNSDSSDELGQIFQENAWDVREAVTARALTEAICILTWDPENCSWNEAVVKKLLPLLALPNKEKFRDVWQQVEDFLKRKNIDKKSGEGLWSIMYGMNMTTIDSTTGSE